MENNNSHYQYQGEQVDYNLFQFPTSSSFFQQPEGYFYEADDSYNTENIYDSNEVYHNTQASSQNSVTMAQQQQSPQSLMDSQSITRPTQKLDARAAELKAQLLKKREERTSSVPPTSTSGFGVKSALSASQSAPETQGASHATSHGLSVVPSGRTLTDMMDLEELLSEGKAIADAKITIKRENTNGEDISNEISVRSEQPSAVHLQKAQRQEITTPQRTPSKPMHNYTNESPSKVIRTRRSDENNSEISDGELREEAKSRRPLPPTGPKEPELAVVKRKNADTQRKTHEKQPHIPHDDRDDGNPRNNRDITTHQRDSARDQKLEQRYYGSSKTWKSKEKLQSEHEHHQRYNDSTINGGKHVSNGVKKEMKTEIKPPTLADLLAIDEDLREWLEMTNWNDVEFRNKKLKNRRALARIEAERTKLLEEIAAEEQPSAIRTTSTDTPAKSADTPAKSNVQHSAAVNTTSSRTPESTRVTRPDRYDSDNYTLKRRYSDTTSAYDEREEKVRHDSRGHKIRIKNEDDFASSSSWNRSPVESRHSHLDRDHEKDRRRDYDRERDMSPGRLAFENRPPPRSDFSTIESSYEREDWHSSTGRGNYRGNRFDPNFHDRGRGRGRGRGKIGHGGRDDYDDPRSPEHHRESHHFTGRSSGKWDKGGKGDTRYFMVKSFNENMILECQRDGVWTTQKHNGVMLTEAFQTCKNVILCFSVNKSKAFQGYARMEGLPGSVEPPIWQKQIHWETAGAFPVRWLNTGRTGFYIVGNVMNIYNRHEVTNEVLSVIVGRDGQEIEGSAGAQLVELMDEEEDRTRRGEPGLVRDGANSVKRYRDPNEEVGAIRSFKSGNYARGGYGT